MLSWESERKQICSIIEAHHSPLKIILKIKDDSDMFMDFFSHHEKIIDPSCIYIFDNGSTDQPLLNQYALVKHKANIFRFNGFHNDIHNPSKFPDLYKALQYSCDHFTFLDSDERLWLLDANKHSLGIVDYLSDHKGKSIPGVWLSNMPGSKDIFNIGPDGSKLESGITWGKPLFSSTARLGGYLNHNIQSIEHLKDGLDNRCLFVLHLNNLSTKQRIRANIRKLVARRFIDSGATIQDILSMKSKTSNDANVNLYIDEISRLSSGPRMECHELLAGTIRLAAGNAIEFYSANEARLLTRFLSTTAVKAFVPSNQDRISLIDMKTPLSGEPHESFRGHVDGIFSGQLSGWAVDSYGNSSSVRVFVNNVERVIVHTVGARADLFGAGISKGREDLALIS